MDSSAGDLQGLLDVARPRHLLARPALLALAALACLLAQAAWHWHRAPRTGGSCYIHTSPSGAHLVIKRMQWDMDWNRVERIDAGLTPGPFQLDWKHIQAHVDFELWGYEIRSERVPRGWFTPETATSPARVNLPDDGTTFALTPRVPVLVPALYWLRDWPFVPLALVLGLLFGRAVWSLNLRLRVERKLRMQLDLGDLGPGIRIGRYVLDQPLGQGGMARVFQAHRQGEAQGERLAIKVLADRFTQDETYRERFLREADICRRLDHPHIVHIFDWGEDAGHLYLVMELVEGQTLAEPMSQGPLEPARAVPWALEISRALACAHALGIVHRDIKPANVMLDRAGRVKVMDFGIARRTDFDPVTLAGAIGTPHYMAPEVIQGDVADWRADAYALGMTLYEMLSGRHPFEGSTMVDLLRRQVSEEPPPLQEVAPSTPLRLARLVHRLLSKEPARRADHPEQICRELERLANPGSTPGGR